MNTLRWTVLFVAYLSFLPGRGGRADAADVALVRGGEPAAALVVPAEPEDDESLAAKELQDHLRQISGAELPIVAPDAVPPKMLPVLIGGAAPSALVSEIRRQGSDPGALALVVEPKRICLRGNSAEGTLFAAYELLEQIGVRWFFPGELGTVVPEAKTVSLPAQKLIQVPSFPARHTGGDRSWKRRVRHGGPHFPGCHGLPGLSHPRVRAELFEKKPGLFGEIDGQRVLRQVCLSNPEALRIVVDTVKEYFRKRPDSPWIGMGPNDGGGFCECEECRKLDGDDWDPFSSEPCVTDRYIDFFNRVLEGIEGEFPKKKICFYAYHTYMRPPVRVKPDRRIVPALAPIALCRIHGPNNPVCPEKQYYKWLVREWGKRLPEVYDRGYWFNLADPGFPFQMVHRIREQVPLGHELGIRGWRVETLNHWIAEAPSVYIASKLMWNHEADVDALLDDYCQKCFGPAAEPMRQYLDLLNTTIRDADHHTGSSFDMPHIYTPEVRQGAHALLRKASSAAGRGTISSKRVLAYQLDFQYVEAFIQMIQARAAHDWAAAKQALDRIDALRERLLELDPNTLRERYAVSYMRRFFRPCTEQGYARVTDGSRLVAGLGDEWGLLTDPTEIGEMLGWWKKELTGGNWRRVPTSTTSWSNLGLRYYKGLAWYRQTVEVPAEFRGKRIFLWFGGIDEKAKVWVNGQEVGISPEAAFVPFEFDATGTVLPGERNSVAVLVRNERVNELGTGGIMAPVMFYAPKDGPKAKPENVRPLGETFP